VAPPAGILREVTIHFLVDARAHHQSGGSLVKAGVTTPSGATTDAYVTDKGDGTYRAEYTAYEDGEAALMKSDEEGSVYTHRCVYIRIHICVYIYIYMGQGGSWY